MGRAIPYCIEFDDCYDISPRGRGWGIKKDGEWVDGYYYTSKFAAASRVGRYIET